MTLEFFCLHTIHTLPGSCRALPWERLILLASYKEPSITHAAIALAAISRAQALQPDSPRSENFSALACMDMEQYGFALSQYSKAMGHLRTHIATLADNAIDSDIEVVLLLTLLFFCFNILQQDDAVAVSHLVMGLRILRSNLSAGSPESDERNGEQVIPVRVRPKSGIDVLAQIFVRLDSDSFLATPDDEYLRPVCNEPIPKSFSSLDEALVRI